jgi:hypothetical protein
MTSRQFTFPQGRLSLAFTEIVGQNPADQHGGSGLKLLALKVSLKNVLWNRPVFDASCVCPFRQSFSQ